MGGSRWGHGGVPAHVYMHMHACICTHIHMYTCLEIANGCPHGGIHVYHDYNMHVHACVHACMYACIHRAHTPTPTPTPINTPATPQGDPKISKIQ